MTRIELSDAEVNVIEQQLAGKIEVWSATDEERTLLSSVIDKAETLLDGLDAYAELEKQGGDLIDRFIASIRNKRHNGENSREYPSV